MFFKIFIVTEEKISEKKIMNDFYFKSRKDSEENISQV